MIGEPLSKEWRLEHVKMGDQLMVRAYAVMASWQPGDLANENDFIGIDSMVQMAVAHYTAANVRARLS